MSIDARSAARQLGGEASGRNVSCPGPNHSPADRSLSITFDPQSPEGFVCHSHAGDSDLQCRDYVREKLGLPAREYRNRRTNGSARNGKASGAPRRVVATYDYGDELGHLVFQVLRYDPKDFRQRRKARPGDDLSKVRDGWLWSTQGARRVIYRLPDVLEAIAAGKTIAVAEGEKDVNSLWEIGVPATCNVAGAKKWRPEDSAFLKDADVVILPDADDPGREHADLVARSLKGVAKRVCVVHLPGDGKDPHDWISAGGTAEQLQALIDNAEERKPQPASAEVAPYVPLRFRSVWEALKTKPSPRVWHWQDWMPGDDVTGFFADGGTGKTNVGMQLAYCTSASMPFLGAPIRAGGAIYFTAEEHDDEFDFRAHQIAGGIVVPDGATRYPFEVVSRAGEDALLCHFNKATGGIEPTPLWRQLVERMGDLKCAFLGIDPSADVYGGNEIDRAQVRAFINMLRKPAIEHKCAILLAGHASVDGLKTGRGYSGSTAWHNGVRARWYFLNPTADDKGDEADPDLRQLSLRKTNRARPGQRLLLRWRDGWFGVEGERSDTLKLAQAKAQFMTMLAAYTSQGRFVSHKPSPTYAPKIFAEDEAGKPFKSEAFKKAMDDLFSEGRLRIETYGPPSHVRSRLEAT